MTIRDDIVQSAVNFLQDPSVATSPIESRIAFLQSKNLTQAEVDAALARAGGPDSGPDKTQPAQRAVAAPQPSSYPPAPVQQYGGYQQAPQYGWQQQPQAPPVPKRDWRDWFIMATVVSGVGLGLYTLTKRYIVPLVAPPTPEKLEQDKQHIDEKFDRAFALIDQLSADTTELKNAEQARTERLDKTIADLESVMGDLKSANRRREDDAQRVRDDVQGLKDSIPRAMDAQKDMSETRLRDLSQELKSLKTLLAQRMAASSAAPGAASSSSPAVPTTAAAAAAPFSSNFLRPGPTAGPGPSSVGITPQPASVSEDNQGAIASSAAAAAAAANGKPAEEATGTATVTPKPHNDYAGLNRASPFNSGMPAAKASIPAWQLAMATKSTAAAAATPEAPEGGAPIESHAPQG